MSGSVVSMAERKQQLAVAERATEAIAAYERACERHADAVAALTAIQAQRPVLKVAALQRLCGTAHPVTGRPYSVSDAKDVLELDEEYHTYKALVAQMELDVLREEDAKMAAWLTAQLAIAKFKLEGGLS